MLLKNQPHAFDFYLNMKNFVFTFSLKILKQNKYYFSWQYIPFCHISLQEVKDDLFHLI